MGGVIDRYEDRLSELNKNRSLTDKVRFIHSMVRDCLGCVDRIAEQGFGSSYTLPMYHNDSFLGFVFFNSYQKHSFSPEVLYELDLFGHLISLLVTSELATIRMMLATVQAARQVTTFRDPETGLQGDSIPIEARIIAVADIFDALTSRRRYKVAWSNQEAFTFLERLAGFKLDRECVAALVENHETVTEIQRGFNEEQT